MTYNPRTKTMSIPTADLDLACIHLRTALRHIRKSADIPIEGGPERPGPMDYADFAEAGILSAAEHLGIDLGPGSDHPGGIDVRSPN